MATLKVNTIQNTSAAHGSTPEQIAQGRAKAWCNFDQTNHSIRDSFNVSSLTDTAVGQTEVNYTNSLSNSNYCGVIYTNARDAAIAINNYGNDFTGGVVLYTDKFAVSSFNGSSFQDGKIVCILAFGDQ